MRAHAADGGSVVLATHDVELAARCATHAVVLGDGEVVADGDARTVLAGSLFAPQVLRVLPPFLTVEEVAAELQRAMTVVVDRRTAPRAPRGCGRRSSTRSWSSSARPRSSTRSGCPRPRSPTRPTTATRRSSAALVGALVVVAVMLEVRRGTMNGATVALLGMLAACAGLLRLIDLPGGGSGIFFLVVLAGAAFGPRFGLLLGLCAMAVSAIVTGGIGPWLPFQMLALGWMGGGAGLLGRVTARLDPRLEVGVLAAYGWVWGFLYGAILNLWFWPFAARRRARLAPRAQPRRHAAPLLAVLRGDVARAGTPPPRSPTR